MERIRWRPHWFPIGIVTAVAAAATLAVAGSGLLRSPTAVREGSTTSEAESPFESVSALGRLEPLGSVVRLASAPTPGGGGARLAALHVETGDRVEAGEIVARLDSHERRQADLVRAQEEVAVARANLAVVQAGAKAGEIDAQKATIARLEAERRGAIAGDRAEIARLEAELAGERLTQAASIQRLEVEREIAAREFARNERLELDGVISASDLDGRRLTLQTVTESLAAERERLHKTVATLDEQLVAARANARRQAETLAAEIQAARATLERIAEVRPVDIALAEAQVQQAKAALQQAAADLELTYVRAPTAGRVLAVQARPGEAIESSEGIIELGNTTQMLAVAEVYESDIAKVRLGQGATIVSETGAFTGQLQGTVLRIGQRIGKNDVLDTDPAADIDTRVVEVEIAIDPKDSARVAALSNSTVIVELALE